MGRAWAQGTAPTGVASKTCPDAPIPLRYCRRVDLRLLRYFVAVAEERHVGRAAVRLHMTQPPLSRAVRQLEGELGALLFARTPTGVVLTAAGTVLYDEARTLLERAEQVRARVAVAAGSASLTVGVLADSAEQVGGGLVESFRRKHPRVRVNLRETDFTDPTAGLRAGLVDVALTRAPFDDRGISTHLLRSDPVGVVLRSDDPLAGRDRLSLPDLDGRSWFRLPEGTDPVWRAFWDGAGAGREPGEGPVVRTVHECLQAVLWNGTVGLTPMGHALPDGLTVVRLHGQPDSRLVVAWGARDTGPLVRSFVRTAAVGARAVRR